MVQLKLSAFSGFWVPLSWIPSPQCPEAGKEFRYLPVSPPLCALEPPATWPAHRRLAGCLPPSPSAGQVPLTRPPAQKEPACPATAARLVPRQQTSSGPRSALAGCAAPPPFSRPRRRRRRRAEGGGGWISRPRRRRRGPRSPRAGAGRSRGGRGDDYGCRDGVNGGGARSGRAARAAGSLRSNGGRRDPGGGRGRPKRRDPRRRSPAKLHLGEIPAGRHKEPPTRERGAGTSVFQFIPLNSLLASSR